MKIRAGKYSYGIYEITCCGYYPPDKCIWWEAVNKNTGEADYRAHTKRDLLQNIKSDESINSMRREPGNND